MNWTAVGVIVVAVSVGALSKGITGSGLPLVSIPVIAGFFGVQRAVVIMVVPGLVTNAWLLWRYRQHLRATRDLPALLLAGVFGVAIGTYGLTVIDQRALSLALAFVIALYLAVNLARPGFALAPAVTRYASPPIGLLSGVMQGATGVSSPIATPYLHAFRLPREAFVLAQTAVFQVFAIMQALSLTALGLFTPQTVAEGALALVPALIALPLGMRLAKRVPRQTFDRLVLTLLALTAVKLVYDALA